MIGFSFASDWLRGWSKFFFCFFFVFFLPIIEYTNLKIIEIPNYLQRSIEIVLERSFVEEQVKKLIVVIS